MQSHQDHAQINRILALDVGGTFIKSAVIDNSGNLEESIQTPSNSSGDAKEIINAFKNAISGQRVQAVGIAIPGPFDYARGISLMEHKFAAIKSLELKTMLPDIPVRFIHDANAFLLGELDMGAGRGHSRVGGITLGTGLGAAVVRDGVLLCNELGSPAASVSLWNKPFRDGTVEDYISSRALLREYPADNVKSIAEAALRGDTKAIAVWHEFGEALSHVLSAWTETHKLERIIIGGQIANDLELFAAPLKHLPIVRAQLGTRAALYGAAALWRK